jgi:peptidoglycan pentaglycine glycine transferase (the first glycine)
VWGITRVKFEPSCSYEKIDQSTVGGGTAVAWISREPEDTCWDKFLQETPLGQFQQSTIWARAKHPAGWKPVRLLVTVEDEIVAGFQILWQSSWRGRMGYVSKGPVVLPGHHGLAEYATALLQKVAREERFRALVVQPPDLCVQTSERLARSGFMLDVLAKVNDATWMVDLRDGFEAVEQRMSKETRKKVKQAVSRGLRIREGGRQDLEAFFGLMLSTCRRQRVDPNPPDVRHLLALWDAAHPAGCIRLFFAEYEGKPLTGQIYIAFGKTVALWKKGWTCTESQRRPNDLSMYEALKWASRGGYQFCDFSAFGKQMAIAMLSGEPLSPEQERSRHMFHVRFGGSPRLLPEARVYFPNPLIRSAYRVLFYKKIRQAEEECKLGRGLVNNWDGLKLARARKH